MGVLIEIWCSDSEIEGIIRTTAALWLIINSAEFELFWLPLIRALKTKQGESGILIGNGNF